MTPLYVSVLVLPSPWTGPGTPLCFGCTCHSLPMDRAWDTSLFWVYLSFPPHGQGLGHLFVLGVLVIPSPWTGPGTPLCFGCTCHSLPMDRACDTSLFWVYLSFPPYRQGLGHLFVLGVLVIPSPWTGPGTPLCFGCTCHSIPMDRAWDTSLFWVYLSFPPHGQGLGHLFVLGVLVIPSPWTGPGTPLCFGCTCHSIPMDRAWDTSLFWVYLSFHPHGQGLGHLFVLGVLVIPSPWTGPGTPLCFGCTCHSIPMDRAWDTSLFWVYLSFPPHGQGLGHLFVLGVLVLPSPWTGPGTPLCFGSPLSCIPG